MVETRSSARTGLEAGVLGHFRRLHHSLVALSALAFVARLAYYNLLGFRF